MTEKGPGTASRELPFALKPGGREALRVPEEKFSVKGPAPNGLGWFE